MPSVCVDGWWCWLSWPGWGGIAGIVALAALTAAIALGVAALLASQVPSRQISVSVVNLKSLANGTHEGELVFSAIGPQPLYEVELDLIDGAREPTGMSPTTPILEVRGPDLRVPFTADSPLAECWVIVHWWEPNRLGSHLGGIRFSLDTDNQASYWWVRWRFRFFPRHYGGRWVKQHKSSDSVKTSAPGISLRR